MTEDSAHTYTRAHDEKAAHPVQEAAPSTLLGPLLRPPPLLVHEELLSRAKAHPEKTAVVEDVPHTATFNVTELASLSRESEPTARATATYQLSFAQVAYRSSIVCKWIAGILRAGGGGRTVQPSLKHHVVGIYMCKCHESILAYYGILMSGAAYVVLDVNLKQAQLEEYLRTLPLSAIIAETGQNLAKLRRAAAKVPQVRLIEKTSVDDVDIIQSPEAAHVPGSGGSSRDIERGKSTDDQDVTMLPMLLFQPQAEPAQREMMWDSKGHLGSVAVKSLHSADMNSPACLALTSGSTGQPKVIVAPHRMIVNENYARQVGIPFIGDTECMKVKRELFDAGVHFGPDDADYVASLADIQVEEKYAMTLGFLWDMPRALGRGVTAVIVPDKCLYDPDHLVDFLTRHRITRMFFSPSLLSSVLENASLLKTGGGREEASEVLPDLRVVELGFEVTSASLCESVAKVLPHVYLCNEHGSNEMGDTTLYIFDARKEADRLAAGASTRAVPIGVPEANVAMFVCDPDTLAVLPQGTQGEIYTYSWGMSKGYVLGSNSNALNAAAFLPLESDFEQEHDASLGADRQQQNLRYIQQQNLRYIHSVLSRWTSECVDWGPEYCDFATLKLNLYRTGDLGVLNADGQLCVLGRTNSTVKIRGYRVNTGDAEGALMKHPSISAVLVVPWTNPDTMVVDFLIAYYTRNDTGETESSAGALQFAPGLGEVALRMFLLERTPLPAPAVPTRFVCLSAMPRNEISQKYDRKKLPTLEEYAKCMEAGGLGEKEVRVVFDTKEDAGALFQLEPGGSSSQPAPIQSAPSQIDDIIDIHMSSISAEERLVIDTFADVLSLKATHLDRSSNFFHLGGNSLMAMRLLRAVQDKLSDLVVRCCSLDGNQEGPSGRILTAINEVLPTQELRLRLVQDLERCVKQVPVLSIFKNPTPAELADRFCRDIEAFLSTFRCTISQETPMSTHSGDTSTDLPDVMKTRSNTSIRHDWGMECAYMLAVAVCKYLVMIPVLAVPFLFLVLYAALGLGGLFVAIPLWLYIYHGSVLLLLILAKWIFVGRLTAGKPYLGYLRWRIGRQIHFIIKPSLLHCIGCPSALRTVLRMLGAHVEHGCQIHTTEVFDWDLVTVTKRAVLSNGATVSAAEFNAYGEFELAAAHVDGGLGPRAHGSPSSGTEGTTTGGYMLHGLTTNVCTNTLADHISGTSPGSRWSSWFVATLVLNLSVTASLAVGFVPALVCLGAWTDIGPLDSLSSVRDLLETIFELACWKLGMVTSLSMWGYCAVAPFAMVTVTTLCYRTLYSVRTGLCGHGGSATRQVGWFAWWEKVGATYLRLAMEGSLFQLAQPPFRLTNTAPCFLRPMGMRIGKETFVSCPVCECPELISIGDGCVLGGNCLLLPQHSGSPSKRRVGGWVEDPSSVIIRPSSSSDCLLNLSVEDPSSNGFSSKSARLTFAALQAEGQQSTSEGEVSIRIREHCLLANACVVLPGADIGPDTFLGNRTLADNREEYRNHSPPAGEQRKRRIFQGAPAQLLLQQELPAGGDAPGHQGVTHSLPGEDPGGWQDHGGFTAGVQIGGYVLWHCSCFILLAHTIPLYTLVWFLWQQSWWALVVDATLTGWLDVGCMAVVLLLHKRLVARKLTPASSCTFGGWTFLFDELTKVLNQYVGDGALHCLKGGGLYTQFLRLSGAKVDGSVVWFGNMPPEPDLLQAGRGAIVAPGVDVFTHSVDGWQYVYEPVTIGCNCVLGERSSMMGYSEMEDASQLKPLTQMMKGTLCHAGMTYMGNPGDVYRAKEQEPAPHVKIDLVPEQEPVLGPLLPVNVQLNFA